MKVPRSLLVLILLFSAAGVSAGEVATKAPGDWQSLFDGKSLDGWKANERPGTFTVADGKIVVRGPRSHLFYVGPVGNHDFKNFEFSAEVLTKPGANSGIFFHTAWQEEGWPAKGYEVQVNNTQKDPKRTGGLYGVKDNYDRVASDNQWFTIHFRVENKRVVTAVDGKQVCDYTEPDDLEPGNHPLRKLSHGTIAIQGHDPDSEVHYRNLKLRMLP